MATRAAHSSRRTGLHRAAPVEHPDDRLHKGRLFDPERTCRRDGKLARIGRRRHCFRNAPALRDALNHPRTIRRGLVRPVHVLLVEYQWVRSAPFSVDDLGQQLWRPIEVVVGLVNSVLADAVASG